jgi:hypothetical protein
MSRRGLTFLLIGFGGIGIFLIFAVVVIVGIFIWYHNMFIVGIRWKPISFLLALPFVLVGIGVTLLYRSRSKETPS